MAWNDLKAAVASVITTNGNNEITGAVLQSTLNSIIDQIGANPTFEGVATPSTNPGTPDGNLFYLATQKGSYSNFGGISISEGDGLVILLYSGGWTKINIPVGLKDDILSTDFYLSGNSGLYLDNFIITDSKISIQNDGFSVIRKRDNKLMGYVGYVPGEDSSPAFELTQDTGTGVLYVIDISVLGPRSRASFSRAIKKFVDVTDGSISYPYIPLASFYRGKIIPCGLSSSLVSTYLLSTQIEIRSDISETTDKIAELVPHVMFDISEYNAINGVVKAYASLPDALVDVPAIAKHGGMSIKYVQSSDNEYVQYRLMSDTFNTTPANWQGVDDEPIAGSENLVKSGGVYNAIESLAGFQEQDKFSISDEQGYNIVDFENEHIKTKGFNSEEAAVSKLALKSFSISDEQGYHIVDFEDGDIKTKNFDSSKIRNSPPAGTLKLPVSYIPVYITCNDLNMSNAWGIGTRNKSVNIFLDHFFHTDRELNVVFENGSTFYTVTQSINGEEDAWNGDLVKYEFQEELNVNEDMLKIKVRSILNSETSGIYPKVLQIGDSVTQGWFANYPRVNNAPVQSFSWAKYYFLKDAAEQAGGNYKSLFVGRGSNTSFSYDGVSGVAYAEGKGGKTAKWYVTNQDSPFYTQNGFSLLSYLHKYKTLDIDGETRLVVGSTAGTEVTDVMSWDLCTPNVVVIQLGMNDVLSEWKTYMPQIVNSIKTEFPDMKVIISVLDGCTCNYPSLYPNYQNIFFDNYNNNHTKLMEAYCYALDNWQDEENGVYVLYSGMVMPMPMSCNVRETDGSFDGSIKRYIGVDSIERVPHPSRYAHQEIGYLLYSCIKWILS